MRPRRPIQLAVGTALAVLLSGLAAAPAAADPTVVSGSGDVYDASSTYLDTISFTGPSCETPSVALNVGGSTFTLTLLLDRRVTFGGDTFRMAISFVVTGSTPIATTTAHGIGTLTIDATLAVPGTCTPVTGAGVCEMDTFGFLYGDIGSTLVTFVGHSWSDWLFVTGAPADCGDLALADAGSVDPLGVVVLR